VTTTIRDMVLNYRETIPAPEDQNMPIGSEDEPARYVSIMKRVETLLWRGRITQEWADVILSRRRVDTHEFATLVMVFHNVGDCIYPSLAGAVTGDDFELRHAESLLDAIERWHEPLD
jgi:hypothetical protein